jgi:hypothetical protein
MILPNALNAFIDDNKLYGYCLNEAHDQGKHKARVFKSALGLTSEDYLILRKAILEAVLVVPSPPDKIDQYGTRYYTDFEMQHNGLTATVRACWITDFSIDAVPRLTSCYVLT